VFAAGGAESVDALDIPPRGAQLEPLAPQAMKRFGAPREVAESVVWLVSDRSSFVTGTALSVDAGAMAQ
jgi:NAD(P)-dependent dehydrogenase (short-subunit alcohol dehydrogenase family)